MLILHDEDTLLHQTVELLGAKLIPALEKPERIKAIVASLEGNHSQHKLKHICTSDDDGATVVELAKATHQHDYLHHIETVFQQWHDAGLVTEDESVLPECFRLQNLASPIKPPKDIYARAGYYAFDMSSGISRQSFKSIIASANLAVQAAQLLLPASKDVCKAVFALCRPPGKSYLEHGPVITDGASVVVQRLMLLIRSSLYTVASRRILLSQQRCHCNHCSAAFQPSEQNEKNRQSTSLSYISVEVCCA